MEPNDHRALGQRLDLFHQQDDAPGMPFWHPRGFALYRVVEDHVRRRLRRAGFHEVRTPQLLAYDLWRQSGHAEKFAEAMFRLRDEGREFALKPMSCPGHVQLFKAARRSYRDLPLRLCEFGAVHRNEPSGALHGLLRARAFVQDDAHIFCREDQVPAEIARFWALVRRVSGEFGFDRLTLALSTRPAVRAGDDADWDRAEALLAAAADAAGMAPKPQPGEGAFYGPKLEVGLYDARGRHWQCGTIQLDLVLPQRFDIAYVDADNRRQRPVMLHQAVLGSLERFIGILLEQHDGRLPFWLAPEQVAIATIGDGLDSYAEAVADLLRDADLRVAVDAGGDRLARKVLLARERAIPVLLAVGRREEAERQVSLRLAAGGAEAVALADLVTRLQRP